MVAYSVAMGVIMSIGRQVTGKIPNGKVSRIITYKNMEMEGFLVFLHQTQDHFIIPCIILYNVSKWLCRKCVPLQTFRHAIFVSKHLLGKIIISSDLISKLA